MADLQLSDWLALRQGADAAARSDVLVRALVDALPSQRPLRILDLATGTGSNVRFLRPRLPGPQEWVAVDRDPALLAQVPSHVRTRCLELGSLEDASLFERVHLVTTSALLDLVSPEWIGRLAVQCQGAGCAALFALNYNGYATCAPVDVDDEFILEHFNRHQRASDKGFGPAAGPDAADVACRAFADLGYRVQAERTDWQLAPELAGLQSALIEGWADAVREMVPDETKRVVGWLERRLTHLREGRSHIQVGHLDVAAWPPRPRA